MISIRIMSDDRKDKERLRAVVNAVKEVLEEMGYRVSVSNPYPNRKNSGERYYLRVETGVSRRYRRGKVRPYRREQ